MPPDAPVEAHHFQAIGTNCSLFGVGLTRSRLLQGEFWVQRLGARLTRFSPDSELSRFNASPGHWMDVSQELEALLRESLGAFDRSGGLVNVAVLPSMTAIGYTRPLVEGRPTTTVADARPLPPLTQGLAVRAGGGRLEPGAGIE